MATHVKLHHNQFTAYRRDSTVRNAINSEAQRMASRANALKRKPKAKYESANAIDSRYGSVALASTGRGNGETIADNAIYGTLMRALGGG